MDKTTFWYVELDGGGVESGDSTPASAGAGSLGQVVEVESLDALNVAIDEALARQVSDFEQEQNAILFEVEVEMAELAPEPDNPAPIPIAHRLFAGMGPAMQKKLKAAGVKTIEQLDELGVDGLAGLELKGLTEKKARTWSARAREVLARLSNPLASS